MNKLIMFYGKECPHCHEMMPLVEKLTKEEKVKVKKLEIWHNEKNADLFKKIALDKCLEVPTFINENTKESICGATTYEKLKKLALK